SGLTRSNVYDTGGSWSNFLTKSFHLETGASNVYNYSNGYVFSHTDPRGLSKTYLRDGLGRLRETLHPDGTSELWNHQNLHVESTFDRLGNSNRYAYNQFRQPIHVINQLGRTNTLSYCN